MKKTKISLLSIAIGSILATSLASCKKDRTCECTISGSGMSITARVTLIKVTKKQAKDICISRSSTDSNNNTTTEECSLK